MNKKLLPLLITLMLAVGLLLIAQLTASAVNLSDDTTIDVADLDGSAAQAYTNWSYDETTNTVTVTDDVTVVGSKTDAEAPLALDIPAGVTVEWEAIYAGTVSGDALISLSGAGTFDVATGGSIDQLSDDTTIAASGTDVMVTGGSVTSAGTSPYAGAIYGSTVTVSAGSITNTSGGFGVYGDDVTVSGGTVDVTDGLGIYDNSSGGSITVSGTGLVSSTSGTAISTGTGGPGTAASITVSDGTVSATTGTAISTTASGGATGAITVSGGTVSATTGTAISNAPSGSGTASDLTVSGGTIGATTGTAISSAGTVKMTGGSVSPTGGSGTAIHAAGANSYIEADGSTIVIRGAVTLTGGSSDIYADNNGAVTITGAMTLDGDDSYMKADNGGKITITGAVMLDGGGSYMEAYGSHSLIKISGATTVQSKILAQGGTATVNIGGNVSLTATDANVYADGSSGITIGGNLTVNNLGSSDRCAIYAYRGSTVTINGDIKSNKIGPCAWGGKVIVNGTITAAHAIAFWDDGLSNYIFPLLANSSSVGGYRQYSYNDGSGVGNSYILVQLPTPLAPVNNNASLDPTRATFNLSDGQDVTVTLTLNGKALQAIKNGSYTLKLSTDYAASGSTVTIKAAYLSTLSLGYQTLTFEMNGGTNPILTLSIAGIIEESTEDSILAAPLASQAYSSAYSLMQPSHEPGSLLEATKSNNTLLVNGVEIVFPAIKVDGYNWLKLRDFAVPLNGTEKQFSIDYDEATASIYIATGEPYAPLGDELEDLLNDTEMAIASLQSTYFNGEKAEVAAFNVKSYNYFRLRDLAILLDFAVIYDDVTGQITLDFSQPYSE